MSRQESNLSRFKTNSVKKELDNAKSDNMKLQAALKRYRKMITENSRSPRKAPMRPSDSVSSLFTGTYCSA